MAISSTIITISVLILLNILLFFSLGELNEETAKLMATPRCGVKDKVGPGSDGRSKRYALQGKSKSLI